MARTVARVLAIGIVLLTADGLAAGSPQATSQEAAPSEGSSDADRRRILEGDRWRAARQRLDDWLAVQQIYSAEEIDAFRSEIAERIQNMSAAGLESLLTEMEGRLDVLLGAEAEEARAWIAQILAVARNPESQFGGPLPDVLNMSAEEIQAELRRFQQQRTSRRQAQSAFERSRRDDPAAAGQPGSPARPRRSSNRPIAAPTRRAAIDCKSRRGRLSIASVRGGSRSSGTR
ncbi:MAG TPA: hypothetical protein PKC18_09165 [Lacipirellulaceae bacterium]|nr:hypothetical protein [Lacipirellulaceae bacterium]